MTRIPVGAPRPGSPGRSRLAGCAGTLGRTRRRPPSARPRSDARARRGRGRAGFRRAPATAVFAPRPRPGRSALDGHALHRERRRSTRRCVETERGQEDQQSDQKGAAGRCRSWRARDRYPAGRVERRARSRRALAGVGDSVILCLRPRSRFRRGSGASCGLRGAGARSRRAARPRARARPRTVRVRAAGPPPSTPMRPPLVAPPAFSMKFACFGEITAPPIAWPLSPHSSSMRPAPSSCAGS